MFAVYAAEQQYRHDTWTRRRDHALLASIRERQGAQAMSAVAAPAAAPLPRAPWARPIGRHSEAATPAACAIA